VKILVGWSTPPPRVANSAHAVPRWASPQAKHRAVPALIPSLPFFDCPPGTPSWQRFARTSTPPPGGMDNIIGMSITGCPKVSLCSEPLLSPHVPSPSGG